MKDFSFTYGSVVYDYCGGVLHSYNYIHYWMGNCVESLCSICASLQDKPSTQDELDSYPFSKLFTIAVL